MIKTENFQKAVELINKSGNILITSHTRPDGDACGCIAAMCEALGTLGKNVTPLLLSPLPQWYEFLFTEKPAVLDEDAQLDDLLAGRFGQFDLILIVDTNSHSQLVKFDDYLKQNDKPILVIDHHVTTDGLGAVELVDSDAAATGLIVLDLFDYAGWPVSGSIAQALFVTIASDTGWFRLTNTNKRVYASCIRLVEVGANPSEIYHYLYQNFSYERFKLMLRMLNSLELHFNGRYACVQLTQEDFEQTLASYKDTENLIDECKRIASVEVVALFVEQEDGKIRCSMRSIGPINVCDTMSKFGGGGHAKAAASPHSGSIEEVKNTINIALTEHLLEEDENCLIKLGVPSKKP